MKKSNEIMVIIRETLCPQCLGTKKKATAFQCILLFLSIYPCFAQPKNEGETKVLPIISISTENGVPITSKVDYTRMTFRLTDFDNSANNLFSNNPRDEMRGRGNATWNNNKKPYRIRFRENTSLFERAAYRNWILLAEYRDPTFLTTPVAFHLGRNVFDHQPYTNTYQYVHLFFNGRYDGVYCLTEHRQASPDGVGVPGRVGIDPKDGWMVEMSIYSEPPEFRTRNYNLPILIKTNNAPTGDPNDNNNPYYNFIKNDWNELCDLMVSSRFPDNGYRELVDLDCFVDYIIINEIVANTDDLINTNSVFVYKDKGGKISLGPVWDFEISFGWDWNIHNHIYFVQGTSTQFIPKHAFFKRFYEDPVFLVKIKEHWNNKYDKIVAVADFIKELGEKLRPAIMQDSERWAIPSGGYAYNTYDTNHTRLTDRMIEWWKSRIPWLNLEYNQVEVLPPSRNFGTINNSTLLTPQGFTLVAYGEMVNLTASFEKNDSPFELAGAIMQIPTGDGGFMATINVRPKNTLSRATYNDGILLNGTNQGKRFSLRANLSVTVSENLTDNEMQPHASFQAFMHDGLLHVSGLVPGEQLTIYSVTGALVYQTIASSTETDLPLNVKGLYLIKAGNRTVKVFFKI